MSIGIIYALDVSQLSTFRPDRVNWLKVYFRVISSIFVNLYQFRQIGQFHRVLSISSILTFY